MKGFKEYWKRREGYERLDRRGRRRRNRVELGSTRRRRFWRIKIAPKIRLLRMASPKNLLVWLRDSYVRMMIGLANSRVMSMNVGAAVGYGGGFAGGDSIGGFGFGKPPAKEYDEKMIIQIYKSLMMGQGQLVPRDAARIASEIVNRH